MFSIDHGAPRTNQLLDALSQQERRRLQPFLREVPLAHREIITTERQPIKRAVFPTDAVTSTLVELPEGDSLEVGLMGAEGAVAMELIHGETLARTTVVVQIPGKGVEMSADDFRRQIVEHGGEAYALLQRYAAFFFGLVAQVAACNASHSVQQRLARWLLLVQDRVGRAEFPLTHEYVALMLGVRRAGVSEAANSLRLIGAIDYHRGSFTVRNRELLEQGACGCYQLLRDLMREAVAPRPNVAER